MKYPAPQTLPGIEARTIETSRIKTRVLFSGKGSGTTPVIFLHGNLSSATWWEEVMLTLPPQFQGIAPDQRGFGDADPEKKIDATAGLQDLADDLLALMDTLSITKAHFVGNSLGGSVLWKFISKHPERVISVSQVSPGSPYGFGGTKDALGTPCYPDFAGSGGGLANPEMIQRMADGDRSTDSPFSLRNLLRGLVYKKVPAREEDLLTSALSTHLGPQDVPGDCETSSNWPFVAPGKWGATNALSPKYVGNVEALYSIPNKPPILWIRGETDPLVSNQAAVDPGTLGLMGLFPGWPQLEVYPPQPMLDQTRAVLEKYKHNGGSFKEVVIQDAGHSPFIDQPEAFNEIFHSFLREFGQ